MLSVGFIKVICQPLFFGVLGDDKKQRILE
jgi:hypothetical protein